MCSLFGLMDYNDALNQRQRTKIISVLSRECEVRGTDATGISYIANGHLCTFKRPMAAHKLHFHIPQGSNAIMGHTRLTTQGSERHNCNNHPFTGRANNVIFAVAHNGVIHNDVRLRKTEHLPSTQIQTDSYIIVQLIEKYKTFNFDSLKQVAEKIEGSFTFTILDQQNNLYFVKGDNPICIYHFNGFYLYASTEEILKQAMKKLGLLQLKHSQIKLACGDILKITSTGKQYHGKFDTSNLEMWSYYSYRPYHTFYATPRRNEYQQDLMSYAKCCGIDDADIEMLLDFGYDEDTIEELLYDPALFQSCMDELACDMY